MYLYIYIYVHTGLFEYLVLSYLHIYIYIYHTLQKHERALPCTSFEESPQLLGSHASWLAEDDCLVAADGSRVDFMFSGTLLAKMKLGLFSCRLIFSYLGLSQKLWENQTMSWWIIIFLHLPFAKRSVFMVYFFFRPILAQYLCSA